jgi:hypothetical protein
MALHHQKDSWFGLKMVGVCPVSAGVSAFIGLSESVCIGVDRKGVGTFATYGASVGPQAGGFLGMSVIASNGDLDDQKGKFTFDEGSASFPGGPSPSPTVFGSHAWSGDVDTWQLGGGIGFGSPVGLARGVSYTIVKRWSWPW